MENRNNEYKILQDLLKEIRLKKGVKQVELSEKLGAPQSFISKYESGERRIDLIELKRICDSLNIPLGKFIDHFLKKLKEKQ